MNLEFLEKSVVVISAVTGILGAIGGGFFAWFLKETKNEGRILIIETKMDTGMATVMQDSKKLMDNVRETCSDSKAELVNHRDRLKVIERDNIGRDKKLDKIETAISNLDKMSGQLDTLVKVLAPNSQ